jgi:hypothetical protein
MEEIRIFRKNIFDDKVLKNKRLVVRSPLSALSVLANAGTRIYFHTIKDWFFPHGIMR